MPLTATTGTWAGYDSGTDTSGWLTGSSGTVTASGSLSTGLTWTTAGATDATTGSIYFDTTDNVIRVNNDNTWVTVGTGDNIVFDEPLGEGDAVSVRYVTDSNGICISNPYVEVDRSQVLKQQMRRIMKSNLLIKMGSSRQKTLNNK